MSVDVEGEKEFRRRLEKEFGITKPVDEYFANANVLAMNKSKDLEIAKAYEIGLLRGLIRTLVAVKPENETIVQHEAMHLKTQLICHEKLGGKSV